MIALTIIGLLAAIWVWANVHPAAGVVVGLLGVAGIGWRRVYAGHGALTRTLHPSGRHLPEFIAAQREFLGTSHTSPPSGAFNKWIKDRNRTGVPAGAWLRGERLPTTAELDALAEAAARLPPTSFPDGRPFPGANKAHRLLEIGQLADQHLGTADKWVLTPFIRRLLRCIRNPDGPDAVTVVDLGRSAENASAVLLRHGMSAEARELAAIVATLVEYDRLRPRGEEPLSDAS